MKVLAFLHVMIGSLLVVALGGCAVPAFQYQTRTTVAAESLSDSESMLAALGKSLSDEGFHVSQKADSLSARRDWHYDPTAVSTRKESYWIEAAATARDAYLEVRFDARTEQLVSERMWEVRWNQFVASSAADMRECVDRLNKLVSLEYRLEKPRPSADPPAGHHE